MTPTSPEVTAGDADPYRQSLPTPPSPAPTVYCKSPDPKESVKRFCSRKLESTRDASRPWVSRAASLPSPLRALPRAFCVHTCNLLARTVARLYLPATRNWSQQPAHPPASPVEGFEEEFPLRSSLHFPFSSFLLKLLFNSAKRINLMFACFFFFKLEFFFNLHFLVFGFVVYFAGYEL